MLSEAKKEIKRKQAELYKYYESTEDCLNFMDDKVRALLEQDIGDLKTKIAFHKRNLKKEEYTVLVAGLWSIDKIPNCQWFPVYTSSVVNFTLQYYLLQSFTGSLLTGRLYLT